MKQTKALYLLLIAALMLSLSACGDDDDKVNSNSSLLQGETWTFQKASVNIMGQTFEMTLNEIRQMYSQQMGTSNIMFIDEHLKFEEEYVVMVNTGDRLAYKYYSDGTLWIEGMDDLQGTEGVSMKMRVKSLTATQLVLTCTLNAQGISITEDVYYKR